MGRLGGCRGRHAGFDRGHSSISRQRAVSVGSEYCLNRAPWIFSRDVADAGGQARRSKHGCVSRMHKRRRRTIAARASPYIDRCHASAYWMPTRVLRHDLASTAATMLAGEDRRVASPAGRGSNVRMTRSQSTLGDAPDQPCPCERTCGFLGCSDERRLRDEACDTRSGWLPLRTRRQLDRRRIRGQQR